MSETNTAAVETPVAPKPTPAAKPKAKPAAKKPAAKAAPKAPANGAAFLELSAGDRKIALVKLLRKWEATSAGSSRSARTIADHFGCERKDVRIITCGGSLGKVADSPTCLIATGHVKTSNDDGNGRMGFYLTAKGKSTKFDDAPFA